MNTVVNDDSKYFERNSFITSVFENSVCITKMLEFHSQKERYAEHSVPKAPIEPL